MTCLISISKHNSWARKASGINSNSERKRYQSTHSCQKYWIRLWQYQQTDFTMSSMKRIWKSLVRMAKMKVLSKESRKIWTWEKPKAICKRSRWLNSGNTCRCQVGDLINSQSRQAGIEATRCIQTCLTLTSSHSKKRDNTQAQLQVTSDQQSFEEVGCHLLKTNSSLKQQHSCWTSGYRMWKTKCWQTSWSWVSWHTECD